MSRKSHSIVWVMVCLCTMAVTAGQAWAVVVPQKDTAVAGKQLRNPGLNLRESFARPSELPPQAAAKAAADLAALGIPADRAFVDPRTGRFGTLMPARPLIPGNGQGNGLTWQSLGTRPPASRQAFEHAAWNAFAGFLEAHRAQLGIDPAELAGRQRVTVQQGGDVVQLYGGRTIDGIPVRDSFVTAVVNHGNLVLFGTHRWGDIRTSTAPTLSAEEALAATQAHLGSINIAGHWGKTQLTLVPFERGSGLAYRLVWAVQVEVEGDLGRWEALVDAQTGELLAFEDQNHYATTRKVSGGVYPVTNDGVAPDGVEQAGTPMPFNTITGGTTGTGGNLAVCVDGNITSTLSGTTLVMNDNCGAISLTSAGDIDFGTSGGTDCVTPGLGGAGNTHASRTGFYELNKIQEQARGQLPNNVWLTQQLTSNMNINSTCNAFWNGSVNFYRSGGGCNNTGEIAGVFDHEWGHGMDNNDAVPTISNPGEGIADIYMTLRLNTSCVGRNFRQTGTCGGYGDPCTECSGVRDIDWAKRASGLPHDINFIDAACGAGSGTPCGGSSHCEGAVYAEAVYDLIHRDLPAAGTDSDLALEIGTRLTYVGAGNVGTWFQCVTPFGGCNADGGYLNYLAADDDNGNLADGTPHMTAIFTAFDRHQIACNSPAVVDSGCAGSPTAAPVVTATARDRGVSLSWGAVAGATKYFVFRTEGVFACDFGKVKIGETIGTTFEDDGLQNGREYYYTVIAVGGADTCMGPASACTAVTPVAGANLAIDTTSATLTIGSGDGDAFLDNCETASLSFDLINIGTGTQNNVSLVSVTPVSHPSITIDATSVSSSTLAECATAVGSFDFTADGLSFNDTVVFRVEVGSTELGTATKTALLTVDFAESDLQRFASRTFSFESDAEGWQVVQGTFNRTNAGGGAQGTAWYEASSANLDNQCDNIRSPLIALSSTSTLSLWNQFDIEGVFQGQTWYDRANLGLNDLASGVRTPVNPDGGRTYNASGANGTCGTEGQAGWASSATTWAESTWSASALGSAAAAGNLVQLDVRYGTDPAASGTGFHFDQVTLTDTDFQVPDGQSDQCVCTPTDTVEIPGATCTDGVDNDCDGLVDCNDSDCATDPACQCNNDGVCDPGEDCLNCASDCISGTTTGAVCGNGVCEAGDGEDCVTCPADCNGTQSGNPNNRFCCGNGGTNPVGCSDTACTTGGFQCTETPQPSVSFCCGDAVCEGAEDSFNCEVDCGPAPFCGDGVINQASEACDGGDLGGASCADFGCTGGSLACLADCSDFDTSGCTGCPVCDNDGICELGEDCLNCANDCAGQTGGRPANRFCCGNGTPEGPEGDGTICDGNF